MTSTTVRTGAGGAAADGATRPHRRPRPAAGGGHGDRAPGVPAPAAADAAPRACSGRSSTGLLQAADAVSAGRLGPCAAPAGVVGAALETAWVSTHLALYPFGLLRPRRGRGARRPVQRRSPPPLQRGLVIGDVEAAGTPILLVHGMVDNRSIFTLLRRGLRRRGFGRVLTLNYSPADRRRPDRRGAGSAERSSELVAETGYERMHVVGHSMGGLIARYYVQRLGGDARVHTLVTLGTPHAGTYAGHAAAATGCAASSGRAATLMRELAEPAPGCRTRFLAFWTDLDQLMVPAAPRAADHPDLSAAQRRAARAGPHVPPDRRPRGPRDLARPSPTSTTTAPPSPPGRRWPPAWRSAWRTSRGPRPAPPSPTHPAARVARPDGPGGGPRRTTVRRR